MIEYDINYIKELEEQKEMFEKYLRQLRHEDIEEQGYANEFVKEI